MIKQSIYPKTQRIKCIGENIEITEKLDGSNLVIFKTNGGMLCIAQRNNIFFIDEITENKDKLYKGLYQWIIDNKETLQNELHEGSAICGEWLGMGKLKYSVDEFDKRFYMFAKANITDDFDLYNLNYNHDLFIYPFISQEIPSFIGIVPVVGHIPYLPDKECLDKMYDRYIEKENRQVEGFVINCMDNITKYVRYKNGKLVEYSDTDHKGE